MTYQFNPSQPGVFTELYLPKKSRYQGILYDTLTRGFDWDYVKQHFRIHQESIQKFLQNSGRVSHYTREDIEGMDQVFYGYSMYEVDGVFYGKVQIDEERTQVIRMRFFPKLEPMISELEAQGYNSYNIINLIRRYIRANWEQNEPELEAIAKREIYAKEKVIPYLDRWELNIQLFLFGYIVFAISEEIRKLEKKEEEIWVTSFWYLEVNVVKKTEE
ncbi:hypothetical protein [Microseira wollei]|uniref:Uncharacterized protein n=1 Tax=Microseira wollei NIES-4236 TaxID=2530354 RepID=A0AAV3XSK5_9CYAN|nr:hypothetical protein [Microseira wollei]GET44385.1 hypothetical protein MiSe_92120 [Microseira wollei NIES-4236]